MSVKKLIGRILECIILVALFLIFVFPLYWTIITSFKSMWEAIQFPPTLWPQHFVWTNYVEVWNECNFAHYAKNSVITSVGATVLQITFGVLAAYAFARMEFKFKKPLFFLMLADIMIPAQAIFLPIFLMFSDWGILNTYLSYFLIYIYKTIILKHIV